MFPSALDDRDIAYGYTESVLLGFTQTMLTLLRLPALTLREIEMVRIMEDITDIPQWWKKVRGDPFTLPCTIMKLKPLDPRAWNFSAVEKNGLEHW